MIKTKQFERILFNILTREEAGETGHETPRPTMLWCPRRFFLSQIALEGS